MEEFADRAAKGFSRASGSKPPWRGLWCMDRATILLDEPTNGLDVMAVRTLRALLPKLQGEGHCILFSSHVMQEVACAVR